MKYNYTRKPYNAQLFKAGSLWANFWKAIKIHKQFNDLHKYMIFEKLKKWSKK